MITLPNAFKGFIEQPHQTSPWVWLWEFVLDKATPPTSPNWCAITPYTQDVTWTAPARDGYASAPVTFSAFNMRHSEIETSGEGNLPSMEVSLDNTARFLMPILEQVDIEGNRATLWLLNAATVVSIPTAYIEWNFEIVSARANRQAVTLQLEMPNFFERRVPNDTYDATRCRWLKFGGPECGYVINTSAAFSTCNRTLDECVLRGEDEAIRGIPVLHPLRFGGYPGIPVSSIF